MGDAAAMPGTGESRLVTIRDLLAAQTRGEDAFRILGVGDCFDRLDGDRSEELDADEPQATELLLDDGAGQ